MTKRTAALWGVSLIVVLYATADAVAARIGRPFSRLGATVAYAAAHGGLSKAATVAGFTHAFGFAVGIFVVALVVVVTLIRPTKAGDDGQNAGLAAAGRPADRRHRMIHGKSGVQVKSRGIDELTAEIEKAHALSR